MANVSQVKIPTGLYDIEDTVARRVANQSLQIINERVEEIDGLLENANKIVEVGTEPSSDYTQVLVDPEETYIDVDDFKIESLIGIYGTEFFSQNSPVINAYIGTGHDIVSNANNRLSWCKLLPNCHYNFSVENKANTDITLMFCDSEPRIGSLGVNYVMFGVSATSVDYSFETDSTHIYCVFKYYNTSASTYTESEVRNSISIKLSDDSIVYKRIENLEDLIEGKSEFIVPEIRNGSEGNSGNTEAVCMKYILPIKKEYDYLSVQFVGDISVANEYCFMYTIFRNATEGMTTSEAFTSSSVTKQRYNTTWDPIDKPYIEFPISDFGNYEYIAIATARNLNGVRVPIRIETEQDCLKLRYGFYSDSVSDNDILHNVQNARHIKANNGTPLTLLHFSDLHSDTAALSRIVSYAEELGDVIDDMICTGDMVGNTAEQISSWWDPKVMTCIGNHDTASYNSSTGYNWTALSMANRDSYYISPFKSNWGVTHTNGTSYYYKDYSDAKVRLIVMDSMLYTDNGSQATAQTTWLNNLLSNAITNNLHVLIAIHAPHGGATPIVCSFSKYGQGVMPTQSDCTTPQAVIDTVAAKIAAGLHFIGYLVGHTHQDNIWDAEGDGTQLMYCVTCANVSQNAQWKDSDMHRSTELDAYNLITIDTTNSLVKIVRGGGANIDDHMRPRIAICIDYSTGEVVSE